MNKRILSVLLSLLCSNVVVAAQQKRVITIDEIAMEEGLLFIGAKVPPSQRGIGELIPAMEVRKVPKNLSDGELAVLLAQTLIASGKHVFTKDRIRRVLTPDGTTPTPHDLDAKFGVLGNGSLPEGFADAGVTLPVLLERILDAAHSMLGVLDEKLVPALRAYVLSLLLGNPDKMAAKNVQFATAQETN